MVIAYGMRASVWRPLGRLSFGLQSAIAAIACLPACPPVPTDSAMLYTNKRDYPRHFINIYSMLSRCLWAVRCRDTSRTGMRARARRDDTIPRRGAVRYAPRQPRLSRHAAK